MIRYLEKIIFGRHCVICGFETLGQEESVCTACEESIKGDMNLDLIEARTWALFPYSGRIRTLMLKAKYSFDKRSYMYWRKFLKGIDMEHFEYIVYIPTTFKRYCFRGFNQSFLLGKMMEELGYGRVARMIKRVKFDKSSSLMRKKEREKNMQGAFEFIELEGIDYGACVLIVDDVMTTGATFNAVESILVEAGFQQSNIRRFALAAGRLKGD